MKHPILELPIAGLLCVCASLPAHAAASPNFTYTPNGAVLGGTITVTGNSFSASAAGVNVSVTNATGRRTSLGAAALRSGSFSKKFTIPSTLSPGFYSVNVVDNLGEASINITGTLFLAGPTTPWFTFSPTGLQPGQTFTVSASGFKSTSTGAAVALVSSTGTITLAGVTALTNGAFSKTFTLPALASGGYTVLVRDNSGANAFSATGPMTVGSTAPAVPVGFYPVGVAVNSVTNRVYVPNSGDNTLSVIDGATSATLATVPVGQLPCAVGANSQTNRIYVANVNSNNISVIDGSTNQVIQTVSAGRGPCAVTITPANNRIFVGNYGDNTITVIDGATNTVLNTIQNNWTPGGLGSNQVTGRVYSANAYAATVSVIDSATLTTLAVIPVGLLADAVDVNPQTNRVYVANFMSATVSVIDGSANTVIATIPVGWGPSGVAVDASRNRIFVGNYVSNNVTVIDGNTNAVVAILPVGLVPDGIAVNPVTGRVYSANSNSNNVSVIPQ